MEWTEAKVAVLSYETKSAVAKVRDKKMEDSKAKAGFRTGAESAVPGRLVEAFTNSSLSVEQRLDTFPRYIRRQQVTRYLALYELFKLVLPVKGSIIECGVHHGFGLMSWANFSAVLEPNNLTRRIYGFDTFEGFKNISKHDLAPTFTPKEGELISSSEEELAELIHIYDTNRFLGHVNKVSLISGDACRSIPEFVENNRHLVVSLLFLDFDLFEPTRVALEYFVARMPKGAVIAFDELDNPIWPGEATALLQSIGISSLKLRRFEFDPYISYAQIGE